MKNRLTGLLAGLFFTISFFSCSPDYDNYAPVSSIEDILVRSGWSVQVIDNNLQNGHDYTGYTLLFDGRGTAVCKTNNFSSTGNWQNINEVVTMHINSADPNVLTLNKSWKVTAKSNLYIKFECGDPLVNSQLILTKQ